MKKLAFLVVFALLALAARAQEVVLPKLDSSPLDVVYYPLNACKAKDAKPGSAVMRIFYSRPQKKGREIFGVLEPYGKVWRIGANENTELELFKDVHVNGRRLRAGRYSLFAIPHADKWVFIINKRVDRWGAFTYDMSDDVMRLEVPVRRLQTPVDALTLSFRDTNEGANLVMVWDKTQVEVPFQFHK